VILLIHPVEVVGWLEGRQPQTGVHVMEKVGGPSYPLWDWIAARLASPLQPGKATLQRAVDDFRREFPNA
jgi:hypothetical protein